MNIYIYIIYTRVDPHIPCAGLHWSTSSGLCSISCEGWDGWYCVVKWICECAVCTYLVSLGEACCFPLFLMSVLFWWKCVLVFVYIYIRFLWTCVKYVDICVYYWKAAIHHDRYGVEWKFNIGWCWYDVQKHINSSNGLHGNSSW